MQIEDKLSKKDFHNFKILKKYLSKYTKRAYLVGGAVRDIYLNNPIKDLDIEVYDIKPAKFDKILRDFGAIGVGKDFFVYKWRNIDISLPRVEKKTGFGHRAFDVKITFDEKEASKRRDFTMNALMINIFNTHLLDFWGGKTDIENKIIKIIDDISFKEDSLRVFRAVQFSARFGFKCDEKSISLMQQIDLKDLSKERIFWELEKLFKARYLHYGFYYLVRVAIMRKLFKIDIACKDFYKITKELILHQKNFVLKYYQYYFLYILSKFLNEDINKWLKLLNAPKEYEKIYKLQPKLPKSINDRFLLETSLKMPINSWLENYNPYIKKRAIELGIFKNKFKTNVNSLDVLKNNFKGRDIAVEIKRRELEFIDKYITDLTHNNKQSSL